MDRYISIERFKAVSDGIISVAITLLVLGIAIPNLSVESSNRQLLSALSGLSVDFVAYAVSFFLVYKLWRMHSFMFQQIEVIDETLLKLNGLFLFFISFLPFATRMMNAFHASTAIIFFDCCMIFPQVTLNVMNRYLFSKQYHDEILADHYKMRKHKHFYIRSISVIIIAILSIVCAFFSVSWARWIWMGMFILPVFEKFEKKRKLI